MKTPTGALSVTLPLVFGTWPIAAPGAGIEFHRLAPLPAPKIIAAAEAFSESYAAENILKPPTPGGRRFEYASRGMGARTFIDFGKPVRIAAFRHVIVRLFGAGGKPAGARLTWPGQKTPRIWLSDTSERPIRESAGDIPVPAWGLVTVRAELPD
ncbi:MAG TPA: hypothetical protein PLU30_03280 [Verrucomicrobiae bacterium]|nr:hypothetical protein [Verrucomicrobiae bacterium]